MKPGDLVRVTIHTNTGVPSIVVKLGLLVEYQKWEKIATVLVDGQRKRYRSENVTKAGRRDQEILGKDFVE